VTFAAGKARKMLAERLPGRYRGGVDAAFAAE
jgi:hypothetical protein